jgi:hypothetical protein
LTPLEKDVLALMQRYQREVGDLTRAQRTLPPAERALSRTHANVKEACASELGRLLRAHGALA